NTIERSPEHSSQSDLQLSPGSSLINFHNQWLNNRQCRSTKLRSESQLFTFNSLKQLLAGREQRIVGSSLLAPTSLAAVEPLRRHPVVVRTHLRGDQPLSTYHQLQTLPSCGNPLPSGWRPRRQCGIQQRVTRESAEFGPKRPRHA